MLKEYRSILIVLLNCILLSMPSLAFAEISKERHKQATRLLEANDIRYKDIYNITRFMPYKKGGGFVSVQQLYRELPVFDSDVTFHFGPDNKAIRDTDDNLYKAGNEIPVDGLELDIEQLITSARAISITSEYSSRLDDAGCLTNDRKRVIQLGVYKPVDEKQLYLAWQSTCKYRQTPSILVDAKTGHILRSLKSGEEPAQAKQPVNFGVMLP